MSGRNCSYITGYVDPDFPNPGGPNDSCIIIYGYTPSLPLCILALALFSAALLAHTLLLLRHRTYYLSTLPLGLAFEITGYAARTLSSQRSPYSVPYFVIQYFFIVTAPVFISAAIYTLVSVLMVRFGGAGGILGLGPRAVLWLFITCDILTTTIQIAGAALVGTAYSNRRDPTTPNNILLAGLAIQVATFAAFFVVLGLFIRRSWRAMDGRMRRFVGGAVVGASGAVYVRTCFRLAETAGGVMSGVSTREGFFAGLEFVPVVLAVWVFVGWFPGCSSRSMKQKQKQK
ncbi:hypothetical protein EJ05DRAFT_491737 [Pseudovirgaria hyperparasitica]|uniref:RTA1-domain-containing protein n=1 Tax=Pseudovirgaria hyperparasitica TaxID=470096 RepID=A0A6A6WGP3_9PEZI|nr:uncharacterized protein EJ05DRAFT_491737 [Pseudovirgaria hyperparasitica]KAF2760807.1 hypothetical protein EJ05DRAFT_491737 [Pseudovirgaria hyperparasitica]